MGGNQKTPFLENQPYTGGGQHIPAGLTYPYPRFWNGDCLQIMKWLWSITLLKMMKISYNPDIFCLFTPISHLKYLPWRVGGNLSQLAYLAPHTDFLAVIGYGFWIAVNCFNNNKWICFTKYRYCLLVYKNPFLEIHPFTGGGGGGNISRLVYLTLHPRFWSSDCLQII